MYRYHLACTFFPPGSCGPTSDAHGRSLGGVAAEKFWTLAQPERTERTDMSEFRRSQVMSMPRLTECPLHQHSPLTDLFLTTWFHVAPCIHRNEPNSPPNPSASNHATAHKARKMIRTAAVVRNSSGVRRPCGILSTLPPLHVFDSYTCPRVDWPCPQVSV